MRFVLAAAAALLVAAQSWAQDQSDLFRYRGDEQSRWISPENPTGAKGAGARENKGAKGHAFETIPVGASHVLADISGAGIIEPPIAPAAERMTALRKPPEKK